jgi:hypothetical protein
MVRARTQQDRGIDSETTLTPHHWYHSGTKVRGDTDRSSCHDGSAFRGAQKRVSPLYPVNASASRNHGLGDPERRGRTGPLPRLGRARGPSSPAGLSGCELGAVRVAARRQGDHEPQRRFHDDRSHWLITCRVHRAPSMTIDLTGGSIDSLAEGGPGGGDRHQVALGSPVGSLGRESPRRGQTGAQVRRDPSNDLTRRCGGTHRTTWRAFRVRQRHGRPTPTAMRWRPRPGPVPGTWVSGGCPSNPAARSAATPAR